MRENKLDTITNLFEGSEIRSIWDSEKQDYYFSVVDVIGALTNANIPRNYWSDLKRRLKEEGSELHEKIVQLKMIALDGKNRQTDTLDTEGIFRLIESVPSPKAEPFKMWLASLGKERIDEVFDPEKAIDRAIDYYRKKGYSDSWIEVRLKGILNRKKLTDVWKENGITKNYEYAILTNEIYKAWSGMKANEYKDFKGIRKESLNALDGKDVLLVFPTNHKKNSTVRILKTPKTESSVRKIFLPKSVANMLVDWKAEQDEMKEILGDEYMDYNLVMASTFGLPLGDGAIRGPLKKLIEDYNLPPVVFHSFRHSSVTYKLKLNGGDIKAVQGDSGHAQVNMVTDVYSHILDDDRRKNAELFEEAFYEKKNLDPQMHVQQENNNATVADEVDPELLAKVLVNSEMRALLNSLAKTMK